MGRRLSKLQFGNLKDKDVFAIGVRVKTRGECGAVMMEERRRL